MSKSVFNVEVHAKVTVFDEKYCDGPTPANDYCGQLWELDGKTGCHSFGGGNELKSIIVNGVNRTLRCEGCKRKVK